MYDSRDDSKDHIQKVARWLDEFRVRLAHRAVTHDLSKFEAEERVILDEFAPKLAQVEYGTPEYFGILAEMKPGLEHHYANNSHHPEHYRDGINGMDLLDIVEMICDWKAATERRNGDFSMSLETSFARFKVTPQLQDIIRNTALRLDMLADSADAKNSATGSGD